MKGKNHLSKIDSKGKYPVENEKKISHKARCPLFIVMN
jgi:hypothetical protein